ncbi:MAG: ribonucleoside triphosphate reductase, partial [Clostridia bacterium]|nr:ribonucleoside triphosphate reductase [Clostridia bacterium]
KEAEVYSRITGYYRPVQNWNTGKRKEYDSRKVYDIDNSMKLWEQSGREVSKEEECECEKAQGNTSEILLFTTKTCPNCKMSKMMLDKAGIAYTVIDAEENVELTKEYGVNKAPTMLVVKDGGVDRYENASNIKGYIESVKG